MKIWFGLSAITLAGVVLFGIKGLLSDEKAYRDLRQLDHFATHLLQCKFLASELRYQGMKLTIYQDLQAQSSDVQAHVQQMSQQSKQVSDCLDRVPFQALKPQEQALIKHIQADYRQFLGQAVWLDAMIPVERAANLPDRQTWETEIQIPLKHLINDLSTLFGQVQQRTDALYRHQRDMNWRNHIMILICGGATGLVLQGLAAFTYKLVNKQYRLLKQLETLARTDALTGIANRRVWDEELGRATERARRSRLPLTVVLLDLDHFKRFNDTYGHQAGDALLQDFGHLLRTKLREGDLIARYGGEEFAMLLHGCPAERALEVIHRLRAGVPYGQTFSAGITESDGFEASDTVLARADVAMYQAKAKGRNCSIIVMRDRPSPPPVSQPDLHSTPLILPPQLDTNRPNPTLMPKEMK